MKKYLAIVLFSSNLILACGPLPKLGPATVDKLATASEEDCGFVQNSYGQRVSWKKSLPVKIYIDPGYPVEFIAPLGEAAQRWEDAMGRKLFIFERTPQSSTQKKDSRNVVYWVNPWTDANKNLQAMTNLYWMGNTFIESDIRVDDEFFSFYVNSPNSGRDVHMESLMVHELGHVLGLKHVSGKPSVMWSVLDFVSVRTEPSATDVANLKCEYN